MHRLDRWWLARLNDTIDSGTSLSKVGAAQSLQARARRILQLIRDGDKLEFTSTATGTWALAAAPSLYPSIAPPSPGWATSGWASQWQSLA